VAVHPGLSDQDRIQWKVLEVRVGAVDRNRVPYRTEPHRVVVSRQCRAELPSSLPNADEDGLHTR